MSERRRPDKPPANEHSCSAWLSHNDRDAWPGMPASDHAEIGQMAQTAGIHGDTPARCLPAPGRMLRGAHLPALSPSLRGRCACIRHLDRGNGVSQWAGLRFIDDDQWPLGNTGPRRAGQITTTCRPADRLVLPESAQRLHSCQALACNDSLRRQGPLTWLQQGGAAWPANPEPHV